MIYERRRENPGLKSGDERRHKPLISVSINPPIMSTRKQKLLSSSRHAVFNINYHLVFVTKYRRKLMSNDIQTCIKSFMVTKTEELHATIKAIETMDDHIHLFIACSPNVILSKLVKILKGSSNRYLRSRYINLLNTRQAFWAPSYFAETIGCISEKTIVRYINNQKLAAQYGRIKRRRTIVQR